jgi:hypothetical protein
MGTSASSRLSRSRLRCRRLRPTTSDCSAATAVHVRACLRGPTDSSPATCSNGTCRRHSAATTSLCSPLFLRDHGWPARRWLRLQQPRIRCLCWSLRPQIADLELGDTEGSDPFSVQSPTAISSTRWSGPRFTEETLVSGLAVSLDGLLAAWMAIAAGDVAAMPSVPA